MIVVYIHVQFFLTHYHSMCHHGEVLTFISLYEHMCSWGWHDAIGMDASDCSLVHEFHLER